MAPRVAVKNPAGALVLEIAVVIEPDEQPRQSSSEVAPGVARYRPSGHATQCASPCSLYLRRSRGGLAVSLVRMNATHTDNKGTELHRRGTCQRGT